MPREPIYAGCPALPLEVAFCDTLIRSDSRQDHVRLEGSSFTLVGPPQRLHSDQGKNFESLILGELCKAFGVTKPHG